MNKQRLIFLLAQPLYEKRMSKGKSEGVVLALGAVHRKIPSYLPELLCKGFYLSHIGLVMPCLKNTAGAITKENRGF